MSRPGLPTDRAHARFELELPCYCSFAAVKSRFACTELLSGPALPTERVHVRFGLKIPRHRFAAAISLFPCTGLLGPLLDLLTLGCSESLWIVFNDGSDIITSLDSVVAPSNRHSSATVLLLRRIALPALTVLLLQILVLSVLNCCLALRFQPNGCMPDLG